MVSNNTDLSMCNLALSKLGELDISAFDEETDLAAVCSRIYPAVRDYTLSIHDWNFAKAKRSLVLSGDHTPLNKWENAFVLPSDMLAGPHAVLGDGMPTTNYDIYDKYIYTNHTAIDIDFKRRVLEGEWPPYFSLFNAEATAAELSHPVTGQTTKAQYHHSRAYGTPSENMQGGLFAQAKLIDAQSQPIQCFFVNGDPLTGVR